MSEKKGILGSLFGGKKAGGCCNMEIIEEKEGCDCGCCGPARESEKDGEKTAQPKDE